VVTAYGDLDESYRRRGLAQILDYLWIVVIMAIIIGAMFELGLFNTSSSSQSVCRTASSYLCQNVTMNSSGRVSLSLGQVVLGEMYNVGLSCAAKSTLAGEPFANGAAFMYVAGDGDMVNSPAGTPLSSGSVLTIHNLACFDANGNMITSNANAGQYFSEVLWLNWTEQPSAPGAHNPWLTTKFASAQIGST
jgi:hypothetical protein